MKKIISIVTPSFNQGHFIEETIQSILKQEGDFYLDYIIMDGGSTDNSVEIIKKYENLLENHCSIQKHKGLNFFVKPRKDFIYNNCSGINYRWFSKADNGQSDAINNGLKISKGNIVAFLNSDDVYLDNTFNTIINLFQKNNCDVVYGNGFYNNENGVITSLYNTKDINTNDIHNECFICQPTVFMKKEVIDTAGYFNELIRNSFDYEYWVRLWHADMKFLYTNTFLACSRMYAENKTSLNRKEIYYEILSIMLFYTKKYNTSWMFNFSNEFSFIRKVTDACNKILTNCATVYIRKLSSLRSHFFYKRYKKKSKYIIEYSNQSSIRIDSEERK